ncbi:MAG: hypothetical protein N4A59_06150 [Marinifilum sp.]|jgi:hypothetical protein|nr:hypothetical protein [Marinifilum sp.]
MTEYNFNEIQNFVLQHANAEHYEKDLQLYKKLFPTSSIIKELENPFPMKKKELDERMIYEILKEGRVCMETILENRGIVKQLSFEELVKTQIEENQEAYSAIMDRAQVFANDMDADQLTALTEEIKTEIEKMPGELKQHLLNVIFKSEGDSTDKGGDGNIDDVNEEKEAAHTKLLELKGDLSSLKYNERKKLVYDLDLHKGLPDMKGATIEKALNDWYAGLSQSGNVNANKKKEGQE